MQGMQRREANACQPFPSSFNINNNTNTNNNNNSSNSSSNSSSSSSFNFIALIVMFCQVTRSVLALRSGVAVRTLQQWHGSVVVAQRHVRKSRQAAEELGASSIAKVLSSTSTLLEPDTYDKLPLLPASKPRWSEKKRERVKRARVKPSVVATTRTQTMQTSTSDTSTTLEAATTTTTTTTTEAVESHEQVRERLMAEAKKRNGSKWEYLYRRLIRQHYKKHTADTPKQLVVCHSNHQTQTTPILKTTYLLACLPACLL
jgi:hypothetical protein